MTTKTIFIDNPEDYQVGDLFSGTLKEGTTHCHEGNEVHVVGTLTKDDDGFHSGLYVETHLPYAHLADYWENVSVTRRVEEPPKYLDFAVGSVVKHVFGNRYLREEDGWFGLDSDCEFTLEEMDETIQDANVFKASYSLVRGPQPTPREFAHKDAVQVGDTVRTNGKGGAYEAGYEFVVTEIVEQESLIQNLNTNIYYKGDKGSHGIWSTFVDKVK